MRRRFLADAADEPGRWWRRESDRDDHHHGERRDQRSLTIQPGMRVVFVNNDSRPHEMTSDPHPSHEDCPELNQVGFLNPGQQRESGNLVFTRTCGFHDHANPGTQSLQGTVTIR